jgi:epsilon-lactone hydrolase
MKASTLLRASRLYSKALAQTALGRLRRGPLRPSWSASFETLITFLRLDWSELKSWELPRLREYLHSLPVEQKYVKQCELEPYSLGGVAGELFVPREASATYDLVVYFHGGSYLFGSSRTHADTIARLAVRTRTPVFAPNYRLAPEDPWPAQLEDAVAILEACKERRVGIAGDSAGGHLVLQLARRLAATPAAPRATVAISPWIDPAANSDSYQRNAAFDYGFHDMLLKQAKKVAPDPQVFSLVEAEPIDFGPLLVQIGDAEILYDEVVALVEHWRGAGLAVELDVLPDMPHAASNLAAFAPAGDEALTRAAEFLRRRAFGAS